MHAYKMVCHLQLYIYLKAKDVEHCNGSCLSLPAGGLVDHVHQPGEQARVDSLSKTIPGGGKKIEVEGGGGGGEGRIRVK